MVLQCDSSSLADLVLDGSGLERISVLGTGNMTELLRYRNSTANRSPVVSAYLMLTPELPSGSAFVNSCPGSVHRTSLMTPLPI
jgi:hypothetical protein